MRNGFCSPILSVNRLNAYEVNTWKWQPSLGFIQNRSCCQVGGTARACYCLGCSQSTLAPLHSAVLRANESAVRSDSTQAPNHWPYLLLHNNFGQHVAIITRQKLFGLGLEVLIHPLYSVDLASSDYHLIFTLSNALHYKIFFNEDYRNQC